MNKVRKTSLGRTGNDTGYIFSLSHSLSVLSKACAVSDSAAEGS